MSDKTMKIKDIKNRRTRILLEEFNNSAMNWAWANDQGSSECAELTKKRYDIATSKLVSNINRKIK